MSGGFNSRNVPAPYRSFFDPEKVRDVELGFKGDFLDNKLRVNLAAFHAWQKGVQRIVNTTFVDSEGDTQLTQFVTNRSEEHTSELQSLMRISYAVFCLKKKKKTKTTHN